MVFAWRDISFYFGPAFLSFTLPALIIAFLGWRLGRLLAMRQLTVRKGLELAAAISLVPLISWANSLLIVEEFLGESLDLPILGGAIALGWGLALFFALLSWAFNLDDFWAWRRQRKARQTEGGDG